MIRIHKFILLSLLFLVSTTDTGLYAQNIENMLNFYGYVFTNMKEDYFDEAENYLMNINKDSIDSNVNLEMQYHLVLSLLYEIKYSDFERACQEHEIVYLKMEPHKYLPDYRDLYKSFILGYAYHLMNFGKLDKAESILNKIIIDNIFDEFDVNYYNTFDQLARVYENKCDSILAEECHNKCQEFLVKRYIRDNPQYSFYLDNFNTIKYTLSSLEKKHKKNTEKYINNLCSLGTLLHKIDYGEYWESYLLFQKALDYAQIYNLTKSNGLSECFVSLQHIIIKYVPESIKTKMIDRLISTEIEYFSNEIFPSEIYNTISTTFAVNKQPEKAIEYGLIALDEVKNEKDNHERQMKIYQGIIYSYLDYASDSCNNLAFEYLKELEKIVTENDDEYYDWCLQEKGIILRYLERIKESQDVIISNLKYFKKKYGKISNQYVGSLNQLSMTFPEGNSKSLLYLNEAKEIINSSDKIQDSIVRGISINMARYYISKNNFGEARKELSVAEDIEKRNGQITPLTEDLIKKCTQ